MIGPLRRVAAAFAAMAQSRIELASLELGEALERAIVNLVLAFVGLLLLAAAVLALSVLVVVLAGEAQRTMVLAILVVVYLAAGLILLNNVKARVRANPPLLASTLNELRQDARALGKDA